MDLVRLFSFSRVPFLVRFASRSLLKANKLRGWLGATKEYILGVSLSEWIGPETADVRSTTGMVFPKRTKSKYSGRMLSVVSDHFEREQTTTNTFFFFFSSGSTVQRTPRFHVVSQST